MGAEAMATRTWPAGTALGKAANHPVHSITWYDMVKWCNARSEKEGLTPCYTARGGGLPDGQRVACGGLQLERQRLPPADGGGVGEGGAGRLEREAFPVG